jgi:hypothetical protein
MKIKDKSKKIKVEELTLRKHRETQRGNSVTQ